MRIGQAFYIESYIEFCKIVRLTKISIHTDYTVNKIKKKYRYITTEKMDSICIIIILFLLCKILLNR